MYQTSWDLLQNYHEPLILQRARNIFFARSVQKLFSHVIRYSIDPLLKKHLFITQISVESTLEFASKLQWDDKEKSRQACEEELKTSLYM